MQVNKSRLAIVAMILAIVFFGVRISHRSWWLRKIVRETEQEIVYAGFELKKLESPIGPQLEAPISIDTLEQFMEEAKTAGVDTIYCLPHKEGPSFYIGRKGMYIYSFDLKIVPVTRTLFPKYVRLGYPLGMEDAVRIEIYRVMIHDMYNRSSFTRGRKVAIFINPIYRNSKHHGDGSSGSIPSPQPSEGEPLLLDLLQALEELPAKKVSFARRDEVVGPMSMGGRVREGGAFITIETTMISDDWAEVEASIYYGNLGAEWYRYELANIDGSWVITKAELTQVA